MIFISHSSNDKAVAVALRDRLLERGYGNAQIFLDSDIDSGIRAGSLWEQVLYERLKDCSALIVLCSARWKESKWCFAELVYAKAVGKEIFPVLLEPIEIGGVLGAHQAIDVHVEGEAAYQRLWKALDSRHLGPQDSFGWPPVDGDDCPFPGLLSFDERTAGVYFGREIETRTILEELRKMRTNGEPRLLMIVGGSGSGKSSLLKAGILPRLKHKTADSEWTVLPALRYGETANEQQTILDQLVLNVADAFPTEERTTFDWKSLLTLLAEADVKVAVDAFIDAVRSLTVSRGSADATTILPIDQFEELLAPRAGATAERFLEFLKETFCHTNGRLLAIGTMRSDYLDVYERHPHALGTPFFHAWRLGAFPRERIHDIILKPAARTHVEIEADLVDRLERDTPSGQALPLLAFTLEKLYRRHAVNGKIELRDYLDLGGMEGAIQKSADAIALTLPPGMLEALRLAFVKHLAGVNSDGEAVRVTARWSDIPADVQPVLEKFVKERLLVTAEHFDDGNQIERWISLEVAHEALFHAWPLLRDWLRGSADVHRWRWDVERFRPSGGKAVVLTRAQLAVARSWPRQRASELTNDEVAWIERAVLFERIRYGLVATIMIVIAALGFMAWRQKVAADSAAGVSLGRLLASQSAEVRRNHARMTVQSLLLAIEGYRRDRSATTAAQLHAVLDATPLPLARFKHERGLDVVRFSPDGKRVAIADERGVVTVWDLETNTVAARMDRGRAVSSLLWRPDGEQIAIHHSGESYQRGEVHLWDWRTQRDPVRVDEGTYVAVGTTRSPEAWLVSASGARLTRWSISGGKHVVSIPQSFPSIALDESGSRMAVMTRGGVVVLNPITGEVFGDPISKVDDVNHFALSADGHVLATANEGGTTTLWDWANRRSRVIHQDRVFPALGPQPLAISRDGSWVAEVSDAEKSLSLWRADTGRDVYRLDSEEMTFGTTGVRFTDDGRFLICSIGDSAVRVLSISDIGGAYPLFQFASEAVISDFDVDASGSRIAIADDDGFLTLWAIQSDHALRKFRDVAGGLASPKDDSIALMGFESRIVDARAGTTVVDLGHAASPSAATFSANGQRFAAARHERHDPDIASGHVVVADLSSRTLRELTRQKMVVEVAFSTDGNRLLIAHDDGEIVSIDLASNQEKRLVTTDAPGGRFSPDGRFYATAKLHESIIVYRLDGKSKGTTIHHQAASYDIAFSKNGEYIAGSVSPDLIQVWRTSNSEMVLQHKLGNSVLQFDPSDRLLAAAEGAQIHFFDLERKQLIRSLTQVGGEIRAMAFSNDGTHLAAICEDRHVRIWRLADAVLVTTIAQQHGRAFLQFTADDRYLMVAQGEAVLPNGEYVRLLDWQPDDVIREACRRAMRRSLTRAEWDQFLSGQPYRETCSDH